MTRTAWHPLVAPLCAVVIAALAGSSVNAAAQSMTRASAVQSGEAQPTASRTAAADDTAEAQTKSQPTRPVTRRPFAPAKRSFGFGLFAHVGALSFTAKNSFEAVLGKPSGNVFGGGAEVRLPLDLFARVDISQFKKNGQRAFVSNGVVYPLGILNEVTLMPIEVTGGIRHPITIGGGKRKNYGSSGGGLQFVPFGGAGLGSVRYQEEDVYATADEAIDERFKSYHVVGGVDVLLWKGLGVGFEYQQRWVPDALGAGGISAEFAETDLGGGTVRARVVFSF